MSFFSPSLFAVLIPLAALPLVIHLLNKGFPRRFKFPSIELIRQTMAQRSKLHQWRHWVLLVLRTLVLLLLLLAFLQPVLKRFGADPTHAGGRNVLIVFDHSVSMEFKGDGPSSRERAIHEANNLIDSLGPEDSVNILLLQPNPATAFVAFSKDHGEAKRFLARLKPGLGRADVNLANSQVARLLNANVLRPEIYYVSDFQRKNWANANFTMLPPEAKLFFVDVGSGRPDNRAILDARLAQTQILAGDTVALEVTVGNFSREGFNGRLTVVLDQKFSFDQEVAIAPWSEGKFTVPISAGGPGLHLCEVRLPADGLEYDNQFRLTLAVQNKEEVLIVTDAANEQKSGAFYLKTALNPFENQAGSLLPVVVASKELSATRLAGVRKIFLTRINRLGPEAAEALAKFLFQGGGLIYFLDGPAEPENLASIETFLGANTIPLRLAQHRSATNIVSGAQQIARGDFKSRYLKIFQGATRQDLALLEFYDYYQAAATSAGGVLLNYTDDTPALAEVHHGLGTLLLLNFSASEFSSNLARQRIFPAWMQELVKAVSSEEPPPAAHTIGETLQTEVWRAELNQDFISPSRAHLMVKRELKGERCSITFTPEELGFYTLGAPRPLYAFGINTSADEADLRPIEKDVLPKEFAENHEAHFVAGAEDFDELAKGRPVFHWFVIAALVCLLLESGFQFLIRRKAV